MKISKQIPIIFIIFFCFFLYINTLNNGLGRTPQMGWNTWNKFGCNINEKLIRDTIDTLNSSGLIEAGYKYINLDDCWQIERDNITNKIKEDPIKFPSGIKKLADYAHEKGLLLGLYSDAGNFTCAGRPGSLGYEKEDAETYAEWGIDYLKYDNCYNNDIPSLDRYPKMRDALNRTNHSIFYSICQWGEEDIPTWGKEVGNSWRTTGDISDNWNSMLKIIDLNDQWYNYSGPGGWNDPDMLEVGNGGMTLTEYKTHFSLWAISKAPLLIGCDITKMTEDIKKILTNSEVIAINQDSLGQQGHKIKQTPIELPDDYEQVLYESELEVLNCTGTKEQKWYINPDGSIQNNNESLCMEIPDCVDYDTKVKTCQCHLGDKSYCSNSTNQLWIYDESNFHIISKMDPSKCLDVYKHKGPSVQTFSCGDYESQKWIYDENNHTLKSNGKCLASLVSGEVTEVWAGKLSDGAYAVLLVNRGSFNSTVEVTWSEIGFDNTNAKLRDLWNKKDLGTFENKYSITLEKHDCIFLKVWPEDDDNYIIFIVIIVAGSAIVISIILVLAFYLRMKNKSEVEINENDRLIDSRTTKIDE